MCNSVLANTIADKEEEMMKMMGRIIQAPIGFTWSMICRHIKYRKYDKTCDRWERTIILYLSTAMAMMVREDMYTAMQGKVFIILEKFHADKSIKSGHPGYNIIIFLRSVTSHDHSRAKFQR